MRRGSPIYCSHCSRKHLVILSYFPIPSHPLPSHPIPSHPMYMYLLLYKLSWVLKDKNPTTCYYTPLIPLLIEGTSLFSPLKRGAWGVLTDQQKTLNSLLEITSGLRSCEGKLTHLESTAPGRSILAYTNEYRRRSNRTSR